MTEHHNKQFETQGFLLPQLMIEHPYLGNDPWLGLVRIVDDLGVLRDLFLAPDARVEIRPYAAAVLADHHLARPQIGLVRLGPTCPRRRRSGLAGSARLVGARRWSRPRGQLQLVGVGPSHDLLRWLSRRRGWRPARRRVLRPAGTETSVIRSAANHKTFIEHILILD